MNLRRVRVSVALIALALSAVAQQVPNNAVPIGPFVSAPGIDGVAVQLAVISSIQSQISRQNTQAKQNFTGACSDWTLGATHSRELGLTLAPKPVPALLQVMNTAQKDKDSPVYVWMTDGAPVGTCPDLAPLPPPPPAGNVAIGAHLYGNYWAALPTDTVTIDGAEVTGTSSDGISGRWRKVMYPFGGWWLKIQ